MRIPLPAARAGGISARACGMRITCSAQSWLAAPGTPEQSPVPTERATAPRRADRGAAAVDGGTGSNTGTGMSASTLVKAPVSYRRCTRSWARLA